MATKRHPLSPYLSGNPLTPISASCRLPRLVSTCALPHSQLQTLEAHSCTTIPTSTPADYRGSFLHAHSCNAPADFTLWSMWTLLSRLPPETGEGLQMVS